MLIAEHRRRDIPHRDAAPGVPLVPPELPLRSPGWDRDLVRDGDWEGDRTGSPLPRDGFVTVSGPGSNQDGLLGTVPRCVQTGPH